MLKSRRLTALLSQALVFVPPPLDTFKTNVVDQSHSEDNIIDISLSISPPPKIVMVLLLSTTGNLLAASSSNTSHGTQSSLGLSPSVTEDNRGLSSQSQTLAGSLHTNASAIHLSDLSPKPKIYASYIANVWRTYSKTFATGNVLFDRTNTDISWIAVENEESSIVIHAISENILLAHVGEKAAPVGLIYAKASAMAKTLAVELKEFNIE
ncbi:hypothetical protein V1514DRAFT_327228 [Lipomyces japonicus]|uniref:uncharacterized protein n=1 Tax=Lipomyces japonicus TaxID=56871 RepID=UPI0034CF4657